MKEMSLDTKAEVLCNLRGVDPNDDATFEAIKAEIVRDGIEFDPVEEDAYVDPQRPYHRWPSNENIDKHQRFDRCLECGVRRYPWPEQAEEIAKAQGPCPGRGQ